MALVAVKKALPLVEGLLNNLQGGAGARTPRDACAWILSIFRKVEMPLNALEVVTNLQKHGDWEVRYLAARVIEVMSGN